MSSPDLASALILLPHWADLLLSGDKTWELRSVPTTKRERVAIAASGTGKLLGEINIIDCVKVVEDMVCLLPLPLEKFVHLHRVPDISIFPYTTIYAWVMSDPTRYEEPKTYTHHPGAIVWVSLNPKGSKKAKVQRKD